MQDPTENCKVENETLIYATVWLATNITNITRFHFFYGMPTIGKSRDRKEISGCQGLGEEGNRK